MKGRMCLPVALMVVSISITSFCRAADVTGGAVLSTSRNGEAIAATIAGKATVLDGRTLWFPQDARRVRLADIDACELPQWAFDPTRYGKSDILKPVPCGPFAKAWLMRLVSDSPVKCAVIATDADGAYRGACSVRGRDLAVGMLRAGWARVASLARPQYVQWQRHAMAARHGMWATYVLDMEEWRAKAVDRTLQRLPIADIELLRQRKSEISPPFVDARRRPIRTDR